MAGSGETLVITGELGAPDTELGAKPIPESTCRHVLVLRDIDRIAFQLKFFALNIRH